MTRNRFETLDYGFGIFDTFQGFYGIEIVGKYWNRVGSICAEKAGKFQR